jgi:DMSO/TMAO reductase YedYZ molybdopterin-dependent catalytic subunit
LPAVLQCAGNGRAFFRPTIPGVGWERGAVGNALWGGVRLRDLLEVCGVRDGSRHVHLLGADGPPAPRTPAYLRSIPLERARDPKTLVATHMNGEPLPLLHGGPLRLVVPGWTGNHWIKWLRRIVVAPDEAPGFYQQTAYRMPRTPAPPGAVLDPKELLPVTWLNVKSLIARPAPGARLRPGRVEVVGVAWTGQGVVEGVEVGIDGGWRPAEFTSGPLEGTWRTWRYVWSAEPGRHVLAARAWDSLGQSQPETTPWNRSGYLWNSIERVACEVAPDA